MHAGAGGLFLPRYWERVWNICQTGNCFYGLFCLLDLLFQPDVQVVKLMCTLIDQDIEYIKGGGG